ncbi:TIM barrel protein [Aquirufa antheringensis]
MNSRRRFLQQSSAFLAASVLAPRFLSAQSFTNRPVGIQLFTFFGKFDQDVKGNLQKIAELGYTEIESAFSMLPGFYGMKGKEFMALNKDLGLNWVSHHVVGAPLKPRPGMDMSRFPKMVNLRDDAQQAVDNAAEAGVKYLVCANIPIDTKEEVTQAVETLNKAGELAKKAGLTFCYHNHDAEFKAVEGQKPFDIFASQVPADLLKFELDLGWASKAGVDVVELFKQHPGRFPLCHIKDFDSEFKNILPVGEGVVNYKRIFDAAKSGGLEHFFVEHDFPKDAFESLRISKKALDAIL